MGNTNTVKKTKHNFKGIRFVNFLKNKMKLWTLLFWGWYNHKQIFPLFFNTGSIKERDSSVLLV
jgi:hypothetical protein